MEITEKEQNEIKKPLNAVDYIKNSSFYGDLKDNWLSLLIEKILNDEPVDSKEIKEKILGLKIQENSLKQETSHKLQKSLTYEIADSNIKKITKILKITNIGLLKITEPLRLESELNIFFGKNGAGKSSIYLGLCKMFGKNKNIIADLEKQNEESECNIEYIGNNSKEYTLSWKTGESNENHPVMIFDSEISQVLVEQDQNNKFEIAHLKLEYFTYLRQMNESIESEAIEIINETEKIISDTEQSLTEEIPLLSKFSKEEIKEKLKESFTEKETSELKEYLEKTELLRKKNPEAILRNLINAQKEINNILEKYGCKKDDRWSFSYNKKGLEEINKQIETIAKAQKTFEESNLQKIKSLIPESWISDDKWIDFIEKSIEFLESLDENSQQKYTEDKCVYCQQPLTTNESKKLFKAYSELKSEIKTKLEEEKALLEKESNNINSCINTLKTIEGANKIIEPELKTIGYTKKIDTNTEDITEIFKLIKYNIDNNKKTNISDVEEKILIGFYEKYKILSTFFETKINEIDKAIIHKEENLKDLDEKILSLKEKQNIYKNKEKLKDYILNKEISESVDEKLREVRKLKQALSRSESEFAKIASLEEFKKQLQQEYSHLRFTPPPYWKIGTTTRDGINKRTYSLSDKRLSDIFSEGERKLHSLADFFAQCEINKYKGIFIFDDPVSSLDEENIQYVANRILKLAEKGNQVIVFTHNLYFLNALDKNSKQKVYKLTKPNSTKQIIIENIKLDGETSLKNKMIKMDTEMETLKKIDSPSSLQIGAVYDLISGYIEEYVEKILFNNVVSRYRANIRMTSLSSIENISEDKIKIISAIYENASRNGNRHDSPTETPEPNYSELVSDYSLLKEKLNYKV